MKTLTTIVAAAMCIMLMGATAWGQTITYTVAGSSYTQNFDGLPSTGTFTYTGLAVRALSDPPVSATGMPGWYFVKNTGSGANDLFVVEAGAGTSGGVKDYGAASATDRALGGLGSGTYAPKFGALITNSTGATLNRFTIVFTGEQWRRGSGAANTLTFNYKVGATAINDASGFVTASGLNFVAPVTTGTSVALDGNLAANRTVGITATVSGLTWADGTVLAIRWDKADETGSDDGLAVDDLSFSADVVALTNYYYSGTGDLHTAANWGTNPNGTGTPPGDFTTPNQIFNIRNTSSLSTTAPWTVGGTGSKIVLGDASVAAITLTVTSANGITGAIDISAASSGANTLTLQDATIPTFGSVHLSSTIAYDGSGIQAISVTSYGNLTLSSSGTKTFGGTTTTVSGNLVINNTTISAPGSAPFATIILGGDLTYQGTVTNPPDANSITLVTSGSGTQTITGNGNTARWFRLQTNNSGNNLILSSTGGSTDLSVGNSSGGGITLATGTTLTLNSNTLTFFNGNVAVGSGSGTITCSSTSNIVINRAGTSGTFGTLTLTSGSATLNNLTANLSGIGTALTLGSSATVGGTLTLTSGTLTTTSTNLLTLSSTGSISGGGSTSFVNGPMAHTVASTSSTAKTFPIGKGAAYRPLVLTVTQDAATATMYKAEVFNAAPTIVTLPITLDRLSTVRYANIAKGAGANVTLASLTLNYDTDDGVTDAASLRIAKDDGAGNWVDLGGTGSAPTTGNITSANNFTTFSNFALANNTGGGNPLPIQLASFTGHVANGTSVRLAWRTLTEVNNYGFHVQRRMNGASTFADLANSFVPGHGTTIEPHDYSFMDNAIPSSGIYHYRLRQIDLDGSVHYSEPITVNLLTLDVKENAPIEFALNQNYPNPFNPSTEIKFSVEQNGLTTLKIYNILGQEVATLFNGVAEAGQYYNVKLDATTLASGMYFYKLESGQKNDMKKMLLLR